jgi:hypothetical protein
MTMEDSGMMNKIMNDQLNKQFDELANRLAGLRGYL